MKIRINGSIVEVNRAIFLGCSFVAGDELADHSILGISVEESDAIKQQMGLNDFYQNLLYPKFKWPDCEDFSKKFSWASKLSQKINVECVNLSRGGGGPGHSLFEAQSFIANNTPTNKDVVFIGLTFMERLFQFDEFLEGQVHVINSLVTNRKIKVEELLNFFTIPTLYFNYYSHFSLIVDMFNNCGIEVVFVKMIDQHLFDEYEKQMDKIIKNKNKMGFSRDFDKYISTVNYLRSKIQERTLDMPALSELASNQYTDCGHHGYGHPREMAHEELATRICKEIII